MKRELKDFCRELLAGAVLIASPILIKRELKDHAETGLESSVKIARLISIKKELNASMLHS